MSEIRPAAPLLTQGGSHQHKLGLLDRVDRPALAPVGLCQLGVTGAPRNSDYRVARAARRDPDLEAGRFGDDGAVGGDPVVDERQAARAGRLLVRVGGDEQVAAERNAQLGEHLGGEDHAPDTALHVTSAATVQPAVADLGTERVARPAVERFGRDDVDMAVEEQAASSAAPGEPRHELRPPREAQTRWIQRLAGELGGVWLEDLDLAPDAPQPPTQVLLQLTLLARRLVGLPGGRVEGDQRGHESTSSSRRCAISPATCCSSVESVTGAGYPARRCRQGAGFPGDRRARREPRRRHARGSAP